MEAKEAGKRSVSCLPVSQGAEAAHGSTYRRTKRDALIPGTDHKMVNEICGYSNKKGHGESAPPAIRRKSCTAYNHTCSHCGRWNHFDSVCQSKDRARITTKDKFTSSECEGAVFDALCAITLLPHYRSTGSIILEHHLYNHLCDAWEKRASYP